MSVATSELLVFGRNLDCVVRMKGVEKETDITLKDFGSQQG